MTKQVSVAELRANLSDLLGTVHYGKEPVVVERRGKPFAVLISPEQYQRYQQDVMARFGQTIDELHQLNAGIDPETGMLAVNELVKEVRQEVSEREQQAYSSNG